MARNTVIAAIALLLVVVGVAIVNRHPAFAPQSSPSATTTTAIGSSTPPVRLAIDLYPLYTGATWSHTVATSTTIGTTPYEGALATSTTFDARMNPGKVFTPFLTYYDSLLKAHGWHVVNDLAAGGPMGGQVGYTNAPGTVILVGYHVELLSQPANAPSECPCKVSFSLFSSRATN